jgi:hypothetical protein
LHGESAIAFLPPEIARADTQRKEQLPRIVEAQTAQAAQLEKLLGKACETSLQDSTFDETCDRLEARLDNLKR